MATVCLERIFGPVAQGVSSHPRKRPAAHLTFHGDRLKMQLKGFYENINQLSGNRFSILLTAIRTFTEKQAAQASAGLAYYTFFSIFPLMLVFIAGGSYFLDSHQVFNTVTQFIQQALPISRQVINENLEEILQARGTAGIVSLLILLWSAS